jgi:hypothetical protein
MKDMDDCGIHGNYLHDDDGFKEAAIEFTG